MFGIGETELVIIVLFAFMVFGPDKLPGIGRTIGRALRQFREAQAGFTQVVQTEVLDPAAEAMNVAPTRRTRNRAAELEADSDIEGGEEGTTRRKETFAERRARLEAERKAAAEAEAQAQAEAAAAAESETFEDDADAEAEVTPAEVTEAAAESAPEAEPEPEPEPEAAVDDSLASLYGISAKTTKSARKQKSEDKAAEIAARKAAAEAKAAEEAAAKAAEAQPESADPEPEPEVVTDTDDAGKEDGTEA